MGSSKKPESQCWCPSPLGAKSCMLFTTFVPQSLWLSRKSPQPFPKHSGVILKSTLEMVTDFIQLNQMYWFRISARVTWKIPLGSVNGRHKLLRNPEK